MKKIFIIILSLLVVFCFVSVNAMAQSCSCDFPAIDSDGDGMPDCVDGCPNDPAKIAAGECGCGKSENTTIDTDGDGMPDCYDLCHTDPNKTDPGMCGCTKPEIEGCIFCEDPFLDTDGDGTPDCDDDCPDDPNKAVPEECGCGRPEDFVTDTDGDGTVDCYDACPEDPNKTAPGECGCGEPEVQWCTCQDPNTDTDGDGTPDMCGDECPNDPAKIAAGECGCGKSENTTIDTDGDGMPDCYDLCPADPNKIDPGMCGCTKPEIEGCIFCEDPFRDTDGDGTVDCDDACPNDSAKTNPGTCGCGKPEDFVTDADGDGTVDCYDACPDDPNKIDQGECGCGEPEIIGCGMCEDPDKDTDGDGTPDCVDECLNDPNKTEPGECGCGKPDDIELDTDGDGTPDCFEECYLDPNKTEPGECGCGNPDDLTDTDSDWIPDCCDGCPNDPDKIAPGQCGCSVADTDGDLDGVALCNDCDDTDDTVYPGAEELCDGKDNDCNGITDDPNVLVYNDYYRDADSDGYGDPNDSQNACALPAGYSSDSTDCDDTDPNVNPGATEIYDGIDNDCNGVVDDPNGAIFNDYYRDADNDSHGDPNDSQSATSQPPGYVLDSTDCDDADAATNPGASEICDGKDNNCDGTVPGDEVDADADGVMVCAGDCNDADNTMYPGAPELCDGKDNDCNGTTDDPNALSFNDYYRDADNDGYGDPNNSQNACAQPAGYILDSTDCNDADPNINPGATDISDGIDNNCNGIVDDPVMTDYYRDADNDGYGDPNDTQSATSQPPGYVLDSTDCNDADPNINPAATEVCDGIDNDCNGTVDDPSVLTYEDYYRDADEDGYGDPNDTQNACSQPDGYVLDSTDCDDTDAAINPAAEDVYDGVDNNCDGRPDENCYFVENIIATGQEVTGQSQTVTVDFGLDWNLAGIVADSSNWADNVVRLQLIDEFADPNNILDTDLLISDIRSPSGQTEILWYVMVEIGDAADPNADDYYPVLSWDPNDLGCTEVDGNVCVYEIRRGLGNSGTVRVNNMANKNSFKTVTADGNPVQYFTIVWHCAAEKPIIIKKPAGNIFPWPGVYPGGLGWVGGIPFSTGFPGGLPYPMTSGYAPGLSIPSFPGTYPGFTYPGSLIPWTSYAWTSYVPRFPVTFPALGIFSPLGQYGWPINYWTGFPRPYNYQTGWFYTYR